MCLWLSVKLLNSINRVYLCDINYVIFLYEDPLQKLKQLQMHFKYVYLKAKWSLWVYVYSTKVLFKNKM